MDQTVGLETDPGEDSLGDGVNAGLPERTIHSTRHSLITYLLAMGYGESQVMRVVGHVKSDTLAVNTHMIEEILQDAATAAFARLFPDEEPKLVKEMGLLLKGEPLPEDTSERKYVARI